MGNTNIVKIKTTVRETAKEDKLASKVIKHLEKEEGKKVSKSRAYLNAMVAYAYHLGI